jgi:uncharacterized membrane protein (UPF0127 family)
LFSLWFISVEYIYESCSLKTLNYIWVKPKYSKQLFHRLRGMMFREHIDPFDGIYFPWSKSVHNCFVKFPIDVIFMNKKNEVVKVIRNLRPWRFTRVYFSAAHVLELKHGSVPDYVAQGDQLEIVGL